jgi:hypothetical protein
MTHPRPYLSWLTRSFTANTSTGRATVITLKGLPGSGRRITAWSCSLTSVLVLNGPLVAGRPDIPPGDSPLCPRMWKCLPAR